MSRVVAKAPQSQGHAHSHNQTQGQGQSHNQTKLRRSRRLDPSNQNENENHNLNSSKQAPAPAPSPSPSKPKAKAHSNSNSLTYSNTSKPVLQDISNTLHNGRYLNAKNISIIEKDKSKVPPLSTSENNQSSTLAGRKNKRKLVEKEEKNEGNEVKGLRTQEPQSKLSKSYQTSLNSQSLHSSELQSQIDFSQSDQIISTLDQGRHKKARCENHDNSVDSLSSNFITDSEKTKVQQEMHHTHTHTFLLHEELDQLQPEQEEEDEDEDHQDQEEEEDEEEQEEEEEEEQEEEEEEQEEEEEEEVDNEENNNKESLNDIDSVIGRESAIKIEKRLNSSTNTYNNHNNSSTPSWKICAKDPCMEYADHIYDNLKMVEQKYCANSKYMEEVQGDINHSMRAILIDWLTEVAESHKLAPQTLFLTVAYVDRFLSLVEVDRSKLQLVGMAALLVASKYWEIYPPSIDELVHISDQTYSRAQVVGMETVLLTTLNFALTTATPWEYSRRFMQAALLDSKTEHLADYLSEFFLQEKSFLEYRPSVIAAATIFLSLLTINYHNHQANKNKSQDVSVAFAEKEKKKLFFPLQKASGFHMNDLMECIKSLLIMHNKIFKNSSGSLKAVRERYQKNKKFSEFFIPQIAPLPENFFN